MRGGAGMEAERRLETKHLLDKRSHPIGFGPNFALERRALGEDTDRADQARGRLTARPEEDHERERGGVAREDAVMHARGGRAEHIARAP